MASSAFSFHCMICFEEFDPQTNYPVVLPCGHTYVCVNCANRLDRCMECRTPLTMKIELPPPPNGTATAAAGGVGGGGGGGSPGGLGGAAPGTPGPPNRGGGGVTSPDQKENQQNRYADRIRNSPGYRRRYGNQQPQSQQQQHQQQQHDSSDYRYKSNRGAAQPPPPPQPLPKQRLPLPKNAVLLSLIQASEPARRRAEVEAPPTPQKTDTNLVDHSSFLTGSETPSPGNRAGSALKSAATFPKFSRPSPLFLDNSSSGEHDASSNAIGGSAGAGGVTMGQGQGSQPDDEEHKIRVGTYLEGGPCGTYAVASKNGLLVYPTLFEHTLPVSCMNRLHPGGEEDVVKRDVEEVVKNYRASAGTKYPSSSDENNNKDGSGKKKKSSLKKKGKKNLYWNDEIGIGDASDDDDKMRSGSPVDTELGAWVDHEDCDNAIEAQCTPLLTLSPKSSSKMSSPTGASIPMLGYDENNNNEMGKENSNLFALNDDDLVGNHLLLNKGSLDGSMMAMEAMSDPGGGCLSDENDDVGLSVSLTISDDDDDDIDGISASVRTLPARRSQSIMELRSAKYLQQPSSKDDGWDGSKVMPSKKFVRHFSQGMYPQQKKKNNNKNSSGSGKDNNKCATIDEFDRPLIRLKYGDRVQVVSMDSRGWVKLARGYGYIRLENDKQLVKVGGTSDKACQIEAMLHELSIERNRLKLEQTKLEHLSAGLMIDLQSSLLTSDDHVVVSAPKGLLRSDSELSLSIRGKAASNISLDDIDVSTRSRPVLTPPRSKIDQQSHPHREIRTAKSHSPGRMGLGGSPATAARAVKTPPSPPYGQVTPNIPPSNWGNTSTPTRVNFRTGLSGHRALTSSHAHPHDFIVANTVRSMSNHSGISSSKKPSSRGRSIY